MHTRLWVLLLSGEKRFNLPHFTSLSPLSPLSLKELLFLRSHYNVEDFVYMSHHRPEEHGRLHHLLLSPAFSTLTKHLLKVYTTTLYMYKDTVEVSKVNSVASLNYTSEIFLAYSVGLFLYIIPPQYVCVVCEDYSVCRRC